MTQFVTTDRACTIAYLKLGMQLRVSIAHALAVGAYGVAAELGRILLNLGEGGGMAAGRAFLCGQSDIVANADGPGGVR